MLAAMLIYVLTMDDSMWPGNRALKGDHAPERVPAALP